MTSRLAFVTNAYRVIDDTNDAVRASNQNARIVSLDTNLDLEGAQARLTELLDEGDDTRVFEITIEALLFPDGMIGAPARYSITSPRDNLAMAEFRAFEASINLELGTTTVKVRG